MSTASCSSTNPASKTKTTEIGEANNATPVDMSAVKTYMLPSPKHIETPISYPQSPPVGGDHNPAWQNCGFYSQPVQNETAAHSMEHGAVWITYRPDLAKAEIDVLRGLTTNQTHVLVSAYSELKSPIMLTAWGHQLGIESASDPRLVQFVATFQQGTQTLEPGAPCTGAIGQPE